MARNEQVYTMTQDWLGWLNNRKFFGPPAQKNILARLMDERTSSRGEPDGALSAEMSAFNTAVSSLDIGLFIPFVAVYCEYRPKPVKCLANDLGIERAQFYERAHAAAKQVLTTTHKLLELSRQMRAEVMAIG